MDGTDRAQDEQDLQATADSIIETTKEIAALEREKSTLDADDPRVSEISAEAEALAAGMHRETRVQRAIAEKISADGQPLP